MRGLGRLFLLFLIVPVVDLALLVWIGGRVGFWPTLGLVVATALAGSYLARREGAGALARFQSRLATGGLPARELTDGLIVLVAGVLLLTPGVLTDVAGLFGLFPPTRALIRRRLERWARRELTAGRLRVAVPFPAGARGPAAAAFEEAEIVEERTVRRTPTAPAAANGRLGPPNGR